MFREPHVSSQHKQASLHTYCCKHFNLFCWPWRLVFNLPPEWFHKGLAVFLLLFVYLMERKVLHILPWKGLNYFQATCKICSLMMRLGACPTRAATLGDIGRSCSYMYVYSMVNVDWLNAASARAIKILLKWILPSVSMKINQLSWKIDNNANIVQVAKSWKMMQSAESPLSVMWSSISNLYGSKFCSKTGSFSPKFTIFIY